MLLMSFLITLYAQNLRMNRIADKIARRNLSKQTNVLSHLSNAFIDNIYILNFKVKKKIYTEFLFDVDQFLNISFNYSLCNLDRPMYLQGFTSY
jgi:hypothetical protein